MFGFASSTASKKSKAQANSELSAEEIEEFKELFALVDKDGGGSIDRQELKQLLDAIGVFPSVVNVAWQARRR